MGWTFGGRTTAGSIAVLFVCALTQSCALVAEPGELGSAGAPGGGGTGTTVGGAEPRPAELEVEIVGSSAPFTHTDGLAGQTALEASGGVRSLTLFTDARGRGGDTVALFHHGARSVEVDYGDGARTRVATVPLASLPRGHYRLARLVQAYSRYRVTAMMHDYPAVRRGTAGGLVVMSDDTFVDGRARSAGDYDLAFWPEGGGALTVASGAGFIIAPFSTTAGAMAVVEDGEWAVYFPIDLVWDGGAGADSTLEIVVNMHQAFRWSDAHLLGYRPEVFDVTPTSWEPVVRFGGNRFDVRIGPSP